jgi:hypothetical protein
VSEHPQLSVGFLDQWPPEAGLGSCERFLSLRTRG